jgi:hypothetical protein
MDWHRRQGATPLSPSDRKILSTYASGLAYLDRNNELTQAIINGNRDRHSVANLSAPVGQLFCRIAIDYLKQPKYLLCMSQLV